MPHRTFSLAFMFKRIPTAFFTALVFAAIFSFAVIAPAKADQPGRGLTASFEMEYLKFIIDHHYSALRMTELTAGTQLNAPMPEISPTDGTSPTPNFAFTEAKASSDELKSLARRENRTQREEILEAQGFLSDYYGIDYSPSISPENQQRIDILEQTPPGAQFDIAFIEIFSRHHYDATTRSTECQVAVDPSHVELQGYCRGIVNGQVMQIGMMRNLLCEEYQICDYQPLEGLRGRSSGGEG